MSILFDETEINGMNVKNRFVRSATWEGMCTDEGRCTKDLVELTVESRRERVGDVLFGRDPFLQNIDTSKRNVFLDLGIADALYINGKEVRTRYSI
jgi:2,4-dienoyl-CoA reductase-like NADH-dependent reductase (Old Yellow Enzyme family)